MRESVHIRENWSCADDHLIIRSILHQQSTAPPTLLYLLMVVVCASVEGSSRLADTPAVFFAICCPIPRYLARTFARSRDPRDACILVGKPVERSVGLVQKRLCARGHFVDIGYMSVAVMMWRMPSVPIPVPLQWHVDTPAARFVPTTTAALSNAERNALERD